MGCRGSQDALKELSEDGLVGHRERKGGDKVTSRKEMSLVSVFLEERDGITRRDK